MVKMTPKTAGGFGPKLEQVARFCWVFTRFWGQNEREGWVFKGPTVGKNDPKNELILACWGRKSPTLGTF